MTEQTPAPVPSTTAAAPVPVAGPADGSRDQRRRGRRDPPRAGRELPPDPRLGAAPRQGWRRTHLGWFDASGSRVGAGLVLSRTIPRLSRSYAYLPEGPALPWDVVASRPAGVARPARRVGQGQRGVRAAPRLPRRLAHLGPRAGQEAGRRRVACSASRACRRRSTTPSRGASSRGSTPTSGSPSAATASRSASRACSASSTCAAAPTPSCSRS